MFDSSRTGHLGVLADAHRLHYIHSVKGGVFRSIPRSSFDKDAITIAADDLSPKFNSPPKSTGGNQRTSGQASIMRKPGRGILSSRSKGKSCRT